MRGNKAATLHGLHPKDSKYFCVPVGDLDIVRQATKVIQSYTTPAGGAASGLGCHSHSEFPVKIIL